MQPLLIRPLAERDIPRLAAIDARSNPQPWTEPMLRKELELDFSLCLVSEGAEGVCGFIAAWIMLDVVQIHEIAVAPESRRAGVGSRLLAALFEECRRRGLNRAELEVRADNVPALAFYAKAGFRETGRRKNFYDCGSFVNSPCDAVLLTCEL